MSEKRARLTLSVRLTMFVLVFSLPSIAVRAQSSDSTSNFHHASGLDEQATLWINHWGLSNPGLDGPMEFLSNTATVPIVVAPLSLYGLGLYNHDRDMAIAGMAVGGGELLSGGITQLLKIIVKRDRPYLALDNIRTPDGGAGGYSFPSGHATGVWSLAAGLSFQYPKWYVIAPAAIYATAVSISRPYLGVHYVSDILTGAAIGVGVSYLVYRWENTIAGWFPGFFPSAKESGSTGMRFAPQLGGGVYGLAFSVALLEAPLQQQ